MSSVSRYESVERRADCPALLSTDGSRGCDMGLTIGKKLAIGFTLVLVLLAAMAFVSYNALTESLGQYEDLSGRVQVAMAQARRLEARVMAQAFSALGYLVSRDESYSEQYQQARLDVDEVVETLRSLVKESQLKTLLDIIQVRVIAYRGVADRVFADTISEQGDMYSEDVYSLVVALQTPRAQLASSIDQFIDLGNEMVASTSAEATLQATSAKRIILVASGLALLLGVVIGIILTRSITSPLRSVVGMLGDMAEGKADLTRRLLAPSRDEIGDLTERFNAFVGRLSSTVKQVMQSSDEVEESSTQLATASEQQAEAANQISSSISIMAQRVKEQSQESIQAKAATEQLSSAIEQVARGAQQQAAEVEKTSLIARDIADDLEQAVAVIRGIGEASRRNQEQASLGNRSVAAVAKGMQSIRSVASEMLTRVSELDTGSKRIGEIVSAINDVADQTSLLALNAAIEAARAGEAGRGFAVVAEEVRRLAEHSSQSTSEISQIVERIVSAISGTVDAVRKSNDQIDQGVRLADEAGNTLTDIESGAVSTGTEIDRLMALMMTLNEKGQMVSEAMVNLAAITEESSVAAEEMASSSDEMIRRIESIASMSEENAEGAQEVASSAEEQSATIEEVASSAAGLSQTAAYLRSLVNEFRTE